MTPDLDKDFPLPLEPDRPDCCNGGCAVCVLDGFQDEINAWRREYNEVLARRAAALAAFAASNSTPPKDSTA